MNKRIGGVNSNYADYEEISDEALDAITDFEQGNITFTDLKSMVGREEAEAILDRLHGTDDDFSNLFDNPEDL